jgi:hypothetical protein
MGRPVVFAASTLAVGFVLAAGCGLDIGGVWNRSDSAGSVGTPTPPTTATSRDDATDQLQGMCPATSTLLTGSQPSGSACTSPSQCVATCCDCLTGASIGWLSSSCVNAQCAGSSLSCTRTRDQFCGDAGIGVLVGATDM